MALTAEERREILEKKVRKLINDNPEYMEILEAIIKCEEENADTDISKWGWQMEDIKRYCEKFSGGHLHKLQQIGLVRQGYYSNNYKHFMLDESLSLMKNILQKIKSEEKKREEKYKANTIELIVDVPKYKSKFEQLKEQGVDLLEYYASMINPKIYGLEKVKQALLLSIVSHTDRYGDRGRIHVLMTGDPGTAKSKLMLWLHHYLGADYITHRSTDVGLTGDASGAEITPGALPMADENVICIDELDKFDKKDYAGLLEAMSDGKVTITAGGKKKIFRARVRVIAGCNQTDRFPEELIDRFDFKFKLKRPDEKQEKEIVSTIMDTWFMPKGDYTGDELRAFIHYIKNFEPQIPPETRHIGKKLIQFYIELKDKDKGNIRKDESIIRVAYAIAKINMRDMLPEDIIRAIGLIDESMQNKLKAFYLLAEKEKEAVRKGIKP